MTVLRLSKEMFNNSFSTILKTFHPLTIQQLIILDAKNNGGK